MVSNSPLHIHQRFAAGRRTRRRRIGALSSDWLALLILLLAAGLRLYGLADKSLRQDEIYTHRLASLDFATLFTDAQAIRGYSPLLYIKTRLYLLLGESEFMLRLPSVVEGVVAVALLYVLGKALWDRRVGLAAALLVAANPYQIWWSQDARYYALQWVLTLLAAYSLWKAVRVNRPKYWLACAGAVSLSIYNHTGGLFLLASVGVLGAGWLLVHQSRQRTSRGRVGRIGRSARGRWDLLRATSKSVIRRAAQSARQVASSRATWLVLSLLLVVISQQRFFRALYRDIMDPVGKGAIAGFQAPVSAALVSGGEQKPEPPQQAPRISLQIGASQTLDVEFLKGIFARFGAGPGWHLYLYLVFAALGLLSSLWQRRWEHLLLVPAFLPVPFLALVATRMARDFTPNHVSYFQPLYLLWIAVGVCSISWKRVRTVVPVLCLLLLVGLSAVQLPAYYRTEKQNWRDVALLLAEQVRPDEVVYGDALELQFYQPELGVLPVPSDWDAVLAAHEGIWYVSIKTERSAHLDQWLYDAGFATLNTNGQWSHLVVSHWRRDTHRDRLTEELSASAVSMFSTDAFVQRDRGDWFYYRRNEMWASNRAIGYYETAIRLDPYLDQYAGGFSHTTYTRLLELYWARSRTQVAAALCRKAVLTYPDQSWPFAALIETYVQAERWPEAQRAFRLATLLWPHVPDVYDALGLALSSVGETDAALEVYELAQQKTRDRAWPYLRLAEVYAGRGERQAATRAYQQAIRVEPTSRSGYEQLSEWYLAAGQDKEALAVYQDRIVQDPDQVWLYEGLADLYAELGQPTRAIATYQRASFVEPRYAAYFDSKLGTVRWSLARQLPALPLVYSDSADMVWQPGTGTWVRPAPDAPDVMVGRSVLPVGGIALPDQVLLHPFGSEQPTRIVFAVADNPYVRLETAYGLADQAAGKSTGVEFKIEISRDGGQSFAPLASAVVTQNRWLSNTVSLVNDRHQDLIFKVTADALGSDDYDWLQVSLRLTSDADEWNLAAGWPAVSVVCGQEPMLAGVDGFYQEERRLVNSSQLSADGIHYSDQLLVHPCSWYQDTEVRFSVAQNSYAALQVRYALADEAAGRSNGVGYAVVVSDAQRNGIQAVLLDTQVLDGRWQTQTFDLASYLGEDITVTLRVSALDDDQYDWLLTGVVLSSYSAKGVPLTDQISIASTGNNKVKSLQ